MSFGLKASVMLEKTTHFLVFNQGIYFISLLLFCGLTQNLNL